MAFDWKDFLALADELVARGGNEASKRTAISRAYYCVFNLAYARAELNVGRRPRGSTSHQWCWDQYSGTKDPACSKLGATGNRMKRLRHKADYKSADIRRLDDEVCRMMAEARQCLEDLEVLDPCYPHPSATGLNGNLSM